MKYFFFIIFIAIITATVIHMNTTLADGIITTTHAFCADVAVERKEAYINTPWQNFDFYHSCVINVGSINE